LSARANARPWEGGAVAESQGNLGAFPIGVLAAIYL
jgi:hypothetical protein